LSVITLRSSPCAHIQEVSLSIYRILPAVMCARWSSPRVSAVQGLPSGPRLFDYGCRMYSSIMCAYVKG
jgi:hypothetical protein